MKELTGRKEEALDNSNFLRPEDRRNAARDRRIRNYSAGALRHINRIEQYLNKMQDNATRVSDAPAIRRVRNHIKMACSYLVSLQYRHRI